MKNLLLFTLIRLGSVAVATGLIIGVGIIFHTQIPLTVALIFAIIISLPVSMFLGRNIRENLVNSIAEFMERRAEHRKQLGDALDADTTSS